MEKNIEEILKSITPETSLKEIAAYCDSTKDFELIIANLPEMKRKPVRLSEEIKQAALNLLKLNKLNAAEITTADVQKNFPVTYPQAVAIAEWLKTSL